MEFLQSRVKNRRLQQKIAEQNQGHREFQRTGRTLIPGGEFPVILRFSKIIFLTSKLDTDSHRPCLAGQPDFMKP
jgi:hypothetical protein